MNRISSIIFIFLIVGIAMVSCSMPDPYLMTGNFDLDGQLRALLKQIDKEGDEVRFIIIREISGIYLKVKDKNKQIYFLTNWVEKHPFDPYNAYYLTLVAESYEELGAIPFAEHYYERIVKNHPDLYINGNNIHYQALKKLIQYVDDNELKIGFFKTLISQFEDQLDDIGKVYFSLAKTYEEVGDWSQAIRTYQKFLQLPQTQISGIPDAYKNIEEKIDFYNSDYRKWTYADLTFLVGEIRDALLTKNPAKLEKYKAKANFFTKYGEQRNYDESRTQYFNITSFLLTSDVYVEAKLDIDSNANEAFLKTSNWAYNETIWYFYFKKINFPADPDIHGRWEWAGIYFGSKM
jgi:tetratricopeptide (TPR) repeat protein